MSGQQGMGGQMQPAAGGKGGMGMNRGPAVQMPSPQQLGVNPQQLNQSLQALPSGGLPQYGGPRPFGPGQFNPFDRPMPGPRPALDMMPSGAPKNFAPPSPRKPAPMSGLLSNLYGNFGG